MNTFVGLLALLLGFHWVRSQYQKQHMALLGGHLGRFQVEKHMQTLHEGYLRALREGSEVRRQQIWELFAATEHALAAQFRQVVDGLAKEAEANTRISKLPLCVPYLERFLPAATRDFRELMQIHAAGFDTVVRNTAQLSPQDRAYQLSAELLLMQHSCHWFCKSRNLANARLMARHQVTHEKVLESVSPQTRQKYRAWLQG